jgi:hypothetical protein
LGPAVGVAVTVTVTWPTTAEPVELLISAAFPSPPAFPLVPLPLPVEPVEVPEPAPSASACQPAPLVDALHILPRGQMEHVRPFGQQPPFGTHVNPCEQ